MEKRQKKETKNGKKVKKGDKKWKKKKKNVHIFHKLNLWKKKYLVYLSGKTNEYTNFINKNFFT